MSAHSSRKSSSGSSQRDRAAPDAPEIEAVSIVSRDAKPTIAAGLPQETADLKAEFEAARLLVAVSRPTSEQNYDLFGLGALAGGLNPSPPRWWEWWGENRAAWEALQKYRDAFHKDPNSSRDYLARREYINLAKKINGL